MIKRGDRKYVVLLVALFAILILVEYSAPQPIDWRHTYSKKDKIPYGNFLLFELLEEFFAPPVQSNYKTFYESETSLINPDSSSLLLVICENFRTDSLDTDVLLQTVFNGSDVMIASTDFGQFLSDTLHIDVSRNFTFLGQNNQDDVHATDSLGIRLLNKATLQDSAYYYFRSGTTAFYFNELDSVNAFVIGENSEGSPNFAKVSFGKGNFWLHSNPLVFTNYSMVQEQQREYIEAALSYLPQKAVIWDEYYKVGRNEIRTPLRFILSNEALRWAYYTLIVIIFLFVIFQGKRKQRIIPVITPPKNTSLEFVETIGELYFQQKNHADLAHKKILFFKDYLRSSFFINTQELKGQNSKKVAMRSGLAEEKVLKLFQLITKLESQQTLSEQELKHLSEQIEQFKTKSIV